MDGLFNVVQVTKLFEISEYGTANVHCQIPLESG